MHYRTSLFAVLPKYKVDLCRLFGNLHNTGLNVIKATVILHEYCRGNYASKGQKANARSSAYQNSNTNSCPMIQLLHTKRCQLAAHFVTGTLNYELDVVL